MLHVWALEGRVRVCGTKVSGKVTAPHTVSGNHPTFRQPIIVRTATLSVQRSFNLQNVGVPTICNAEAGGFLIFEICPTGPRDQVSFSDPHRVSEPVSGLNFSDPVAYLGTAIRKEQSHV